jgi:uncharacterized protein YlbG (UPF0298 family)
VNKPRAKMPASQRAKQFAPFDAVVGLRQALKEKEKIRILKKELSEDAIEEINRKLKRLEIGRTITVIWYDFLEENYAKSTNKITKINAQNKSLELENTLIFFEDIYAII